VHGLLELNDAFVDFDQDRSGLAVSQAGLCRHRDRHLGGRASPRVKTLPRRREDVV
jgi:hypothetical protein